MKNSIIVVLVIALSVVGTSFYFKSNQSDDPQTNVAVSDTNQSTAKPTPGKSIDLSGQGLDRVSQDILDDSSASTLDVSNNNLTGSLPGEIRKLTYLEVLDASNNKMTGIPAEIGQLSKLKIANFANNLLTGLPNEIGNLKNLETLDLRGNPNISKTDLSKIQNDIPGATILVD